MNLRHTVNWNCTAGISHRLKCFTYFFYYFQKQLLSEIIDKGLKLLIKNNPV